MTAVRLRSSEHAPATEATMSILFGVSNDNVILLIMSWLNLLDYGLLDLALTNKVERKRWITCLSLADLDLISKNANSLVRWSIKRKMRSSSMRVHFDKSVNDSTFLGITNTFLRELDIFSCKITDFGLLTIAQGCPELKKIKLYSCNHISDEGVLSMVIILQGLTCIYLSSLAKITSTGVIAILERCPALLEISLSGNTLATRDTVLAIGRTLPALKSLNISHTDIVSDQDVEYLAINCRDLLSVSFNECRLLTDIAMLAIVNSCPHLEDISINSGWIATYENGLSNVTHYGATGECLRAMGRTCPNLKSLSISGGDVRGIGTSAVGNDFHRLQRFSASNCQTMDRDTIIALSPGLKELRSITLSECQSVANDSLSCIAEECPELTSFYISKCKKVTDDGISYVAEGCRKLEKWWIVKCDKLTNASLIAVSTGCPDLRHMTISDCRHISDEGVTSMALRCSHLQCLSLTSIGITDASLVALATHSRELSCVSLDCCNGVTSDGLSTLAAECNQLQSINSRKCRNLREGNYLSIKSKLLRAQAEQNKVRQRNRWNYIISALRYLISWK